MKKLLDARRSARFCSFLNLSDKQLANEGSVVEVVKREVERFLSALQVKSQL